MDDFDLRKNFPNENLDFIRKTNRPRVVASFTTIPGRYDDLQNAFKCVRGWVDKIYLGVPKVANRTGKVYPPLPESITKDCEVVPLDEDYGPICKVYGALLRENDPETIIISCDDDMYYDPELVGYLS